jgi:hypothetical protein
MEASDFESQIRKHQKAANNWQLDSESLQFLKNQV